MGEKSLVKLHGVWASSYSIRVELALKIKAIPYEYVEQNLTNKSQELLQLNPVYKKIPVLVHDGKPLCESLVILEYIDESWDSPRRLMPQDAYQRAQARFWVDFIQQQLFDSMGRVVFQSGEAQQKALEEAHEKMKVLEEGLKEHFSADKPPEIIDGENLGFLDIILAATFGAHEAYDEAVGAKILDPENTPMMFSWVQALKSVPAVKAVTPPHDKVVKLIRNLRMNGYEYKSHTGSG